MAGGGGKGFGGSMGKSITAKAAPKSIKRASFGWRKPRKRPTRKKF